MAENFILSVNTVLPIFLMMLAGYLTQRCGIIKREDIPKMNKVVFHVFMPCMVFYNIYSSEIDDVFGVGLLAFVVIGFALETVIACVAARHLIRERFSRGAAVQALIRSSYATMGIPIARNLIGDEAMGAFALMMVVTVIIFNIASITVLEYGSERVKWGHIFWDILKNPLTVGALLGLLFRYLRIPLPTPVLKVVKDFSAIATPLIMLLLGAFFKFRFSRTRAKNLTLVALGRLLIFPLIFLGLGRVLGFRGAEFVVLIGVFATPCAPNSFSIVQQLGGDVELAGDAVVITGALSPLTLLLWCFAAKTFVLL